MRRFELSDGVSSKFWEVDQTGSELHIGFGKIGTAGQRQCKSFANEGAASAAMEKLIREKTAKGYAESGAAAAIVAAPAATAAPEPAAPAATPLAIAGATPPWLDADPLVQLSPELAEHALPSRRHPGPPPSTNGKVRWAQYLKRVREHCPLRARVDGGPDDPGVIEAITRISQGERHGSPESDAILLATETVNEEDEPASDGCPFLDVLVADKGLLYAFDVVLMTQRIWIHPDYDNDDSVYTAKEVSFGVYGLFDGTALALRAHLAHAPQALWEQCVQRARAAAATLHTSARPLLAALLPDAPELANELALMLEPEMDDQGLPKWNSNYAWLIVYATSPEAKQALRLWPSGAGLWHDSFHRSLPGLATALQDRGAAAIDAIMGGNWSDKTPQALGCIGTPEAIAALAERYYQDWQFEYLVDAVERWPDAAMAGLSQVIASSKQGPDGARKLLAATVAKHAHRVPALAPWMTAPAWKVLSVAAAQYTTVRDCADTCDLPPVLAAPPWAAPAARGTSSYAITPLDQGPLQNFPAKIGKLPKFCTPLVWSRPLLAANGKALPDAAMDAVAIMLRFPHADGVYEGINQLKQACTPASLSDFAWDLYFAWVDDGAKAKENWAFYALGLLGDDDTARRLTSLLRIWPGYGLHARAVTGLDVLALMGSDTALMLLNGIALKLKFKALQDRAQEKIKAIAAARGLSNEELEDRIVPDLGLDEQGALLLDFGPRQFRVGFDETLKPFVRDDSGARLADLPKPKKTDDAALSKQAVERFKLLKKDARTIAAQQVLRLELAMCAQRRWTAQVFRDCMVTHPLVRHLAQRLVWGVYDADGRLQACFRVTPEGAFSDAADDAFALPQGEGAVIGIPHALDLSVEDASAFSQLFADYELLQPFVQIGRATHTLDDGEEAYHALGRWNGEVVPTGRLLGLLNQGWRLGDTHDSAMIWDLLKVLGDGYTATLNMEPGIRAGSAYEFEEQTLGSVCIGRGGPKDIRASVPLSSLGAATVSELIADMNKLCA
ncbi:DUF4132 domain-containing protein [Massilia violaceinigra]|uniref:DUF4132 domain-containing protein n=1 Tax=Massilia violaceinigra TaxID=2045208 RepID=A0ABY4AA94_9BURK|nr:DUF4132 domain-containing protein [Massilia violaceinigra]UOD30599.1 DUF4132 domain-containing protein [Massilia violaceinigra]